MQPNSVCGFCFNFCFPLNRSLHWASCDPGWVVTCVALVPHLWSALIILIHFFCFLCPGPRWWQVLSCLISVGLRVHEKWCVPVPWDWGCWGACGHLVCGATMYPENGTLTAQSLERYALSGYSSIWRRELVWGWGKKTAENSDAVLALRLCS